MTEQTERKKTNAVLRAAHWFSDRYFGCGGVLCHAASAVIGIVGGMEAAGVYFPSPVGYFLMIAAVFAAAEVVLFLCKKLLDRFLGRNISTLLALCASFAAVAFAVKAGAGEGWTWRVFLVSAVVLLSLLTVVASLWSLVRRGWSIVTGSVLSISAVSCVLLLCLTLSDGFTDQTLSQYLNLTPVECENETLVPSLGMGDYPVSVLDYGPGEEWEPEPRNLASFMSRGDGFTGFYVDTYLDYEPDAVPMRGRVWYPSDGQNCPVLFIAHGNHEITTPSYLGYEYLGEYLASHGYVVVSVDHNACNMLSGENDARAVLLLEHIELLLTYNGSKVNPLYGVIDEENIAIAGHSRGGEMVATAYLFNSYDYYPENAVVRLNYDFSIRSVIAIAPTVNQYKPADHSVMLEDVNYLLLHGASDRDVTKFMGMSQYENISYSGTGDYLKTALYIAGANHGQFNSLWGEYDVSGMETPLINTESLLSAEEQQYIARLFIKVFLDVTLRGDERCRNLLTDWEQYSAQLPDTVYVQCHEESGFATIADFEEDSKLSTATMDGAVIHAGGVNCWTEDLIDFSSRSSYDTHSLRLRWTDSANFTVRIPQTDMRDASFSFDICDLDFDAVEEGDLELLDAVITLMDASGNTVEAQLSDHAVVYPILSVKTDKLDFLFDTPMQKPAFSTVSIPVSEFTSQKGEIDFSRITLITITFSGDGEVALDNIGITYGSVEE